MRGTVRSALRGGALVEIARRTGVHRVLDEVAERADVTRLGARVQAGSGGAVLVRATLVDGTAALLRVGRAGTPADPAHVADELERLAAAAVPLAPRLLARGEAAGASWVAELALPGRRPAGAGAELTRQVVAACARFPRFDGPPGAVLEDLEGAARMLPGRADRLRRLAAELRSRITGLPSILRHGDLWTGNLLVDRGRLTGMIDWDATHPAGVAGADLVQLLATDARRRAHRSLGAEFVARSWRGERLRRAMAPYWQELGVAPSDELLEVAAIAWWATEIHHTLLRLPHRGADEWWVGANVDAVLVNLGY
jgi:aminoglycoside phosphotransferase